MYGAKLISEDGLEETSINVKDSTTGGLLISKESNTYKSKSPLMIQKDFNLSINSAFTEKKFVSNEKTYKNNQKKLSIYDFDFRADSPTILSNKPHYGSTSFKPITKKANKIPSIPVLVKNFERSPDSFYQNSRFSQILSEPQFLSSPEINNYSKKEVYNYTDKKKDFLKYEDGQYSGTISSEKFYKPNGTEFENDIYKNPEKRLTIDEKDFKVYRSASPLFGIKEENEEKAQSLTRMSCNSSALGISKKRNIYIRRPPRQLTPDEYEKNLKGLLTEEDELKLINRK